MKKPIAENGFTYVDDIIPELPDFLEKISKNRESNIDKEIRTGDIGHTEFIGSDHIPTTTGTFGDDKIIGDDYSSSVEVINAGDGEHCRSSNL